jgi:hypothetical protein
MGRWRWRDSIGGPRFTSGYLFAVNVAPGFALEMDTGRIPVPLKESQMIKSALFALATAGAALASPSAHAGVSWSIGINAPVLGAVVSNAPGYYYDEPVYAPAPVYAPVPVYRAAPRVIYEPRPIYYRPQPIVYPRYYPAWGHDRGRWDHRGDRGGRDHDGRRGDRDGHGHGHR